MNEQHDCCECQEPCDCDAAPGAPCETCTLCVEEADQESAILRQEQHESEDDLD